MAARYSYAEISDHPSVGPLAAPMPGVPRTRHLGPAIAGAVLTCLAAAFVSFGPGPRAVPAVRVRAAAGGRHHLASATLLRLPAAARGPISAALGSGEAAYRVSGLRALNPAQQMRLRFSPNGVTLSSGATHLALALAGVGRGDTLAPVRPAAPLAVSNRVSYAHGALREWYVNGPLGLEQGFDLARRPAGRGALTLAVALSGTSRVRLRDRSALISGPGDTLRYGGLSATDAHGHPLHAWLSLGGGRLLIHVDDRGARYPVRIDPFVQQGEPLKAGSEVGAGLFGYSVALSSDGDTALVGGPGDEDNDGAAWVFTRSGGAWTQQGPKLTAAGEIGQGGFGSSVALSADGNTALIAAEGDNGETGAAWVFTRSGGVWAPQGSKLIPGEGGKGSAFGASVALSADGSSALVGAPGTNSSFGWVWAFARSGSNWVQQGPGFTGGEAVHFTPEGDPDELGGAFGASLALSADGNTALVGGPFDFEGRGAAWVFTRSGATWTQQGPKLTGSSASGGQVGWSVALSADGDTALIGAPGDVGGAGAGLIFDRSAGAWTRSASLTNGANAKESLGASVALSADGNIAVLSGVGSTGVSEFVHAGENWEPQAAVMTGGSANVALSADADTILLGGAASNSEVGLAFVVVDLPEVTYLTPSSGPVAGGTSVTIEGSSFTNASAVMFGSKPAASFTVDSPTQIAAVSPPGIAGMVDVTVANSQGASLASGRDLFRYENPPPPRRFSLGHQTVLADGAIELEVEVPGPGVLSAGQVTALATMDRVSRPSAREKSKKPTAKSESSALVGALTQTVRTDEESPTLVFKPTVAALRELTRKRAITVPLQVSFTPTGGQASVATTDIGFARPGYSFEGGSEGWTKAWGDLAIAVSAAHRHSGKHSLRIAIHSEPYSAVNVTASGGRLDLLQSGVPISMWVYRPSGTPPVGFRALVRVGSEWTECRSAEIRPRGNRWVRLSVTVPGSASCASSGAANPEVHGIGVEIDDRGGVAKGKDVYLDDIGW
jgi:hypothetical protein